jgi:GTP cyclohydrolase I
MIVLPPSSPSSPAQPNDLLSDMAAEDAVADLLLRLGEDPRRDGLKDTPARVWRALRELTDGYGRDPQQVLDVTFDVEYDEMVVCSGVQFASLCEHHMLPFIGTATLGYLPGERVVGLSKLARVVDVFAHRLQVQERMTQQIAQALDVALEPIGTGVVITAHHMCMGIRGARQPTATMTTSALTGNIKALPEARAEFLALAKEGQAHGE